MGKLITITTVLSAVISRLLGDEAAAWIPWLTKRVMNFAIRMVPKDKAERCQEEWSGHLLEMPGELVKLGTAISFSIAGLTLRFDSACRSLKSHPIWAQAKTKAFFNLIVFAMVLKCWQLRFYTWIGFTPKPQPVRENSFEAFILIALLVVFISKAFTPAKTIEQS